MARLQSFRIFPLLSLELSLREEAAISQIRKGLDLRGRASVGSSSLRWVGHPHVGFLLAAQNLAEACRYGRFTPASGWAVWGFRYPMGSCRFRSRSRRRRRRRTRSLRRVILFTQGAYRGSTSDARVSCRAGHSGQT